MSDKPSVLILGGVSHCSRALASLLCPPEEEAKVAHLRIADKYSVHPPTTYIGPEFRQTLESPVIEYKQANLTIPTAVSTLYDPPEGAEPYSIVFDLTGDLNYERGEEFHIKNTANVAHICATEAARRNVAAYVRIQPPYYDCSEKGSHDENDDPKPLNAVGTWWHESLRIVGDVQGLNLVAVRIGFLYGPYQAQAYMTSVLTVASVYGYLNKPMKSLWSPGKHPMHTVHVDDIAGALWACAQWMAPLGREKADAAAGVAIPFRNDPSKVKDVAGVPAPDKKVVVPLFNLVDDNETTLVKAGSTMCELFGTKFDFYNFVTSAMFRFRLEDVVEEINEVHVSAWAEMLMKNDPPITSSPVTAYMDVWTLQKHTVAFSNEKLKRIVGYKLKRPQMTQDVLREIVDKWKAEGSWPTIAA
ncbi:NAD-P-binding protein [Peniophora sp. CONT]|nr:NAD-P-binding protein [Peniophora sp. CONT]